MSNYTNTHDLIEKINLILKGLESVKFNIEVKLATPESVSYELSQQYLAICYQHKKLTEQRDFILASNDNFRTTLLDLPYTRQLALLLNGLETRIQAETQNPMSQTNQMETIRAIITLTLYTLRFLAFCIFLTGLICLCVGTPGLIGLPMFVVGLAAWLMLPLAPSFPKAEPRIEPTKNNNEDIFTHALSGRSYFGQSSSLKAIFFQSREKNPHNINAVAEEISRLSAQ